jgi:hypothetical protein
MARAESHGDAAKRAQLESARDLVSVVQDDHRLLGFSHIYGPYGTIAANPIISDVVDEPLFQDCCLLGLEEKTPGTSCMQRERVRALRNARLRLSRSQATSPGAIPSLMVVTPSELVTELRAKTFQDG